MFKKFKNALEEIHKVLLIVKDISKYIVIFDEFINQCQSRLDEFDHVMNEQKKIVGFLNNEDERFKNADE